MSPIKKKSPPRKRGRKSQYKLETLKKPGDSIDILPEEGGYFTPYDAKRITSAVWSHRVKHPLGADKRVLSCRSIMGKDGYIIAVRVFQIL